MHQKWLGHHAGCQEVGRCCNRSESEGSISRRWQGTKLRDLPWLWKTGQMSTKVHRRGYEWPHKKDWCPPKFFKKSGFANISDVVSFLPAMTKCEQRHINILCSIIYFIFSFFLSMHLHCFLHTSLFTYQISISRQATEVVRCNRHRNVPVQHLTRPIIWPTCIHYLSHGVLITNFYTKWFCRVCIKEISEI